MQVTPGKKKTNAKYSIFLVSLRLYIANQYRYLIIESNADIIENKAIQMD